MKSRTLQRYWPETLLIVALTLPWVSLLVLGCVWLWQGGHVWRWALGAAALALITWPLVRFVRRRADAEARLALGDLAAPSRSWSEAEHDAWNALLALADATPPFSLTELDPILARAQDTIDTVARRLHPEAHSAWAQFTLPEVLLLGERLCREVRREALGHIPGVRTLRLSHLLWMHRQNERYGATAQAGWRLGYGLWRIARAMLNPLQAAGQETSGLWVDKAASVLSYRLRAYATRMFVLEVGRAAIDLYSGRLALSVQELGAAQASDMAAPEVATAPVRIILAGQVNAGKSSLVNALGEETRCAVGPMPTTARATEYRLELDGQPAVSLVDMPGLSDGLEQDLRSQAERADLVLWVASATQPARAPDRQALDSLRAWGREQLARRPPRIILALTHIDELRPANEWAPPYDLASPAGAKARNVVAAINSVASALDLPASDIVPIAMPPRREVYNVDALWARIGLELDEARLVQLDRRRVGAQRRSLRELATQLGRAGRLMVGGIAQG
ncbi:MAG: GTPase family protein [Xanthobacteraceae bacterium]